MNPGIPAVNCRISRANVKRCGWHSPSAGWGRAGRKAAKAGALRRAPTSRSVVECGDAAERSHRFAFVRSCPRRGKSGEGCAFQSKTWRKFGRADRFGRFGARVADQPQQACHGETHGVLLARPRRRRSGRSAVNSGPKARDGIARSEGPGNREHRTPRGSKGRNECPAAIWPRVPPLQGGWECLMDLNNLGLHPRLSQSWLSAPGPRGASWSAVTQRSAVTALRSFVPARAGGKAVKARRFSVQSKTWRRFERAGGFRAALWTPRVSAPISLIP